MSKINSPLKHKEGDASAHNDITEADWHAENKDDLTLESMIKEHNERLEKEKEEKKVEEPIEESNWDPLEGLTITQEVADRVIPDMVSDEKKEELNLFHEKKK